MRKTLTSALVGVVLMCSLMFGAAPAQAFVPSPGPVAPGGIWEVASRLATVVAEGVITTVAVVGGAEVVVAGSALTAAVGLVYVQTHQEETQAFVESGLTTLTGARSLPDGTGGIWSAQPEVNATTGVISLSCPGGSPVFCRGATASGWCMTSAGSTYDYAATVYAGTFTAPRGYVPQGETATSDPCGADALLTAVITTASLYFHNFDWRVYSDSTVDIVNGGTWALDRYSKTTVDCSSWSGSAWTVVSSPVAVVSYNGVAGSFTVPACPGDTTVSRISVKTGPTVIPAEVPLITVDLAPVPPTDFYQPTYPTPTQTTIPSPTSTATGSVSPTSTNTAIPGPTPSPSDSSSVSPSASPTSDPSTSPSPSPSSTNTASTTPTPSLTGLGSPSPSFSPPPVPEPPPVPDFNCEGLGFSLSGILDGSIVTNAVGCALSWAFVPDTTWWTGEITYLQGVITGSRIWIFGAQVMAIPLALANNLTDSGTCQGPTATFQLGRGTHTVPYTLKLFDACHEPMASYANISKTAVSAIFGLVAIITVWNLCVGALLGKFATLPNPGDVLLGAVPEHDKAGLVHFGGDDD